MRKLFNATNKSDTEIIAALKNNYRLKIPRGKHRNLTKRRLTQLLQETLATLKTADSQTYRELDLLAAKLEHSLAEYNKSMYVIPFNNRPLFPNHASLTLT